MSLTFQRKAMQVRPGQTVVCDGHPSVVWRTFSDGHTGMVFLTFFTPNAGNCIQMVLNPDDPITLAPLARQVE